jgi:hypothetical protein
MSSPDPIYDPTNAVEQEPLAPHEVIAEQRIVDRRNIYQRINEVRKEVAYVQKDAQIQGYKGVTHDNVTAALRNSLIRNGILVIPQVAESTTERDGKTTRYAGTFDVAFVNVDAREDVFSVRVDAHAFDSGDKAPGKALSMATKLAELKVFTLETGENEEARVEAYEDSGRISPEQVDELEFLIEDSKSDTLKILKLYKVDELSELSVGGYKNIKALCKAKLERANAKSD